MDSNEVFAGLKLMVLHGKASSAFFCVQESCTPNNMTLNIDVMEGESS